MTIEHLKHFSLPALLRTQRPVFINFVLIIVLAAAYLMSASPALAQSKYSAFVMDAESGKILYSRYADAKRYPASLTKMMTLYMAFEALQSGRLNKNTPLRVSRYAAGRPPSKLGLKAGTSIRMEDAIYALVTKSANDAAAVLAEALGGSEARFGKLMTRKARAIGMKHTVFRNASGLPDRKQITTARDMATLGKRLFRDFPQYYHYFSTEKYSYKGRSFGNHNKLLKVYEGADGIKTGYINASGFNLVSSVRRDGYHLIGVVFGGKTARRRDARMISLLDAAFKRLPVRTTPQRLAMNEAPKPTIKPAVPAALPRVIAQISLPRVIAHLPRAKPGRVQIAKAPGAARSADDQIAALISAQSKTPVAAAGVPIPRPAPRHAITAERPHASHASETASISSASGPVGSRTDEYWGVQVGAFSEIRTAEIHISNLMTSYPEMLSQAASAVQPYQSEGQTLFRARLEGFAEAQARGVCKTLRAGGRNCVPVPPDGLLGQGNG